MHSTRWTNCLWLIIKEISNIAEKQSFNRTLLSRGDKKLQVFIKPAQFNYVIASVVYTVDKRRIKNTQLFLESKKLRLALEEPAVFLNLSGMLIDVSREIVLFNRRGWKLVPLMIVYFFSFPSSSSSSPPRLVTNEIID